MKIKELIKFLQEECDPECEAWCFDEYSDSPCKISEIIKVKNFRKKRMTEINMLGMSDDEVEDSLNYLNDNLTGTRGNDIIIT